MTGWFGGCDYTMDKTIEIWPLDSLIQPKDRSKKGFESVSLQPNPNTGNFSVTFRLYSNERVTLKVVDMFSKVWYIKNLPVTIGQQVQISLPSASPGTYLFILTSETDYRSIRFIIAK